MMTANDLLNTFPDVVYVEKKSDLTKRMAFHEKEGEDTFRTRTECQCKGRGNRRDALVVTFGSSCVIEVVYVRCKECARLRNYRSKAHPLESIYTHYSEEGGEP